MTAEERAEEILELLWPRRPHTVDSGWFEDVKMICAQIAEAERDARLDATTLDNTEWHRKGYNLGWTAAREKAAGIIDKIWDENKNCDPETNLVIEQIAERIEKMDLGR